MEVIQLQVQNNKIGIENDLQAYEGKRFLEKQEGVEISFKDVLYQVNTFVQNGKSKTVQKRTILNHITGYCPAGQITAILGASGAGKTSLLNILAQRIGKGGKVTLKGEIQANGQNYDSHKFASFASYVMQNDILFQTLSPRETLTFVANLKYKDPSVKEMRVNDAIKTLKLERCQHSLIGGNLIKGISGGERKRVTIGVEMISNPRVILLDEPTSGLDSFTAFIIINLLKKICREQNRTVVFTIHQPSGDIYELFDRIMLLVDGKFIYQGPKSKIISYFSDVGFKCPAMTNPMDYLISIMHAESAQNRKNYPLYFENYERRLKSIVDQEIANSCKDVIKVYKAETSYAYQVSQICSRAFTNVKRDKFMIRGRIIQGFFIGLVGGGMFWGVGENKNSLAAIQGVSGVFFFWCMGHFMGAINPAMISFPAERDVFLREENAKLYSTSAYFIGKSSVEIPFLLFVPIIQQLISYWMVDLNDNSAEIILTHLFIYMLLAIGGNSVGLMGGAIFQDVKTAAGILPLFLMPLVLFSGFFSNQSTYMAWIGWFQWISPLKYAFEAAVTNEYEGTHQNPDPIEFLDFSLGLWPCVYALIGFAFAYRIIAYFLLLLLKSKQQ